MTLDRRLRDEFDRSGHSTSLLVDTEALARVVDGAARVRRGRRTTAAAVACAVALVAIALSIPRWHTVATPSSPTPTPTSSPSEQESGEPSLTHLYTSAFNGYSMRYPDGWTVKAGTKPWVHGQDSSDSADVFQSPGKPAVSVVSQRIPKGWSAARWIQDFLPGAGEVAMPSCFPPPSEWLPVTVDGHDGGLLGGDFNCSFTEAVVIVDGTAYVFNAMPDPNAVNTKIFDQGLFNELLGSVQLAPQFS